LETKKGHLAEAALIYSLKLSQAPKKTTTTTKNRHKSNLYTLCTIQTKSSVSSW